MPTPHFGTRACTCRLGFRDSWTGRAIEPARCAADIPQVDEDTAQCKDGCLRNLEVIYLKIKFQTLHRGVPNLTRRQVRLAHLAPCVLGISFWSR